MIQISKPTLVAFGAVALLGGIPLAAQAQSVLQAYGRAHDAQFETGKQLGPGATPAQINAARDHDYSQATQSFHAEFNRGLERYSNSAKSALERFNNTVMNMLHSGQAAGLAPGGDKTPEQLQAGAAQQRRPQAPMRPVTAAGGAKGADKVKFGAETSKADPTVVDGIVQDAPSAPAPADANVIDGINQNGPTPPAPKAAAAAAAPSKPSPAAITPAAPKPGAVDDSGIVQDR